MNKRRRNYWTLLCVLLLGSLILDIVRLRMAPGMGRDIVRYVGVGILVLAAVQINMGRANSWFKDKVKVHPHETRD
ncbi:MAG TPA: hypothetical protein VIM64_00140 [Puia sp.]